MIGEVTSLVTATQYVVLLVTPQGEAWNHPVLKLYGVDTTTARSFLEEIELDNDNPSTVIRIGPFTKGSEAALTLTLRDEDDNIVDSWVDNIAINNPNSPAVIVRQAVYDFLEDKSIDDTFLLSDGYRRPASAAEDIPFVAGNTVIEIGAPSSRKAKRTQVRSEVQCEIPINVYVFGHSTGEAYNIADNIAWQIQCAVDDSPNLYLSGLGVNNFTWSWDVRTPDFVEIQGSPVPVVVQEIVLVVPVIWASAPTQT